MRHIVHFLRSSDQMCELDRMGKEFFYASDFWNMNLTTEDRLLFLFGA